MLAATKQRKRGASADAEDAVEKPVLKRGKPSGGGGGLSLAEMLQATGRGTQNSGSDEDNAPLARNWKQPKPQQSKNKSKNKISAVKGAGKEASGDTEAVFELSAKRRVTVRKWKNMVLVDVREFYDDHGTAKPGKKGISLSLDQWEALACRLRDISGAVEIVEEDRVGDEDTATKMTDCLIGADADDDRSIAFTLSPKRRVTVRYFRNGVLIDIREYYDQDGVAKPGKKGISLSKAQWLALQELASDISDAAKKL